MTRFTSACVAPALAALAVAAGACASGPAATATDGGGGATSACGRDTRGETYVAGLAKASGDGALTVRIDDARPAPPGTGDNRWSVSIVDANGAPVDVASVDVTPFMPDHGHGSAVAPVATAAGAGKFEVDKLYLPMPGLWKLTFVVRARSGEAHEVVFQFCLDG